MKNRIIMFLVATGLFFSQITLFGMQVNFNLQQTPALYNINNPFYLKLRDGRTIKIWGTNIQIIEKNGGNSDLFHPYGFALINGALELRNGNLLVHNKFGISIIDLLSKKIIKYFFTDFRRIAGVLELSNRRLFVHYTPNTDSSITFSILDYTENDSNNLTLIKVIEKKLGYNTIITGMAEVEENKVITWAQTGTIYLWDLVSENQEVKYFLNLAPESLVRPSGEYINLEQKITIKKLPHNLFVSWFCEDTSEVSIWDFKANEGLVTILKNDRKPIENINEQELFDYLFDDEITNKLNRQEFIVFLRLKIYIQNNHHLTDINSRDLANILKTMTQSELQKSVEYLYFKMLVDIKFYEQHTNKETVFNNNNLIDE